MSATSIALNRFGLGTRPDLPTPADPKAWLLGQIDRFDARPPLIAAAPSRAVIAGELAEYLNEIRPMLQQQRRAQGAEGAATATPRAAMPAPIMSSPPGAMTEAAAPTMTKAGEAPDPVKQARQFVGKQGREYYAGLVGARANVAIASDTPFMERLVHFWGNHFAVSADKLTVVGMSGLLEFEAIRPHVTGSFAQMLNAVERHPAMLLYLDQAESIGPNSAVAQRVARFAPKRKLGLNENLAREIMELHTLGVRTGYSQADVTEFARAMTGFTVSGFNRGPIARFAGTAGAPGDFVFAEPIHEPGVRMIMGKRYDQVGEAQAQAVLNDLAVHPATARHIATKLARHFAGDTPPPAMVARLEGAFLKSRGDLPTVYRALIASPEAWVDTPAKFKSPWEWTMSAMRAVGAKTLPDQQITGMLTQLGQPVWRPGSPAGYDDIVGSWAGPDAVLRRVEIAQRMAARAGSAIDARALAPKLFPDALSPATQAALANADSPGQALALLLVAPEMMRR